MSAEAAAATARASVDWQAWHAAYEDPESPLAQRLELVRSSIRAFLEQARPGPIRVISICAGQAHDLIGALEGHPRRGDVTGRLVELDEDNVRRARVALTAAGLEAAIEAVCADASSTDAYRGAAPADLILLCGVLGNISQADIDNTIAHLPGLCAAGATVIWTRHRNPPDLVPHIIERFDASGFERRGLLEAPFFGVGSSRLTAAPRPLEPGVSLFSFIGHQALWPHLDEPLRNALSALFQPGFTLAQLVEAVRMLPRGGDPARGSQEMLRKACGTSAPKHLFLAEVMRQSFPATEPQLVHRVHRLDARLAGELYGPQAPALVPSAGMTDVHRYLTLLLEGRRVVLDATLPGPIWDGRSPLALACGPGPDFPVTGDAERERQQLEAEHCEAQTRRDFLAALREAGQPARVPERLPRQGPRSA